MLSFLLSACSSTSIPAFKNNSRKPIDMGDKSATQCAYYVLFFGPFGNRSIPDAAAKAGIKEVTYYDVSKTSYILFSKSCLNVYGR